MFSNGKFNVTLMGLTNDVAEMDHAVWLDVVWRFQRRVLRTAINFTEIYSGAPGIPTRSKYGEWSIRVRCYAIAVSESAPWSA